MSPPSAGLPWTFLVVTFAVAVVVVVLVAYFGIHGQLGAGIP